MTREELLNKISSVIGSDECIFELAEASIDQSMLLSLVGEGNVDAAVLLHLGLTTGVEKTVEPFYDEESGQTLESVQFAIVQDDPEKFIFSQEGCDVHSVEKFIFSNIKSSPTENLKRYSSVSMSPIIRFLVDSELCDREEVEGLCAMADRYLFGDEQNGVFINRKKAEELYAAAAKKGSEFAQTMLESDVDDYDTDDMLEKYQFKVSADSSTLKSIVAVMDSAGCEDGTIHLPHLFMLLVGTSDYSGSVISYGMEGDCLVLAAMTSSIEALAYAFQYTFENVSIEIVPLTD